MSKKNTKEKSLSFKNSHVDSLLSFITEVTKTAENGESVDRPLLLHGAKARARNKITDILFIKVKEIEKNRFDIIKKYSEKDKGGEPKRTEDDKGYVLQKDKIAKFDEEFTKLMEEDCVFDILPSNAEQWRLIKEFVLKDIKTEMDYKQTQAYEEICEAFEKI